MGPYTYGSIAGLFPEENFSCLMYGSIYIWIGSRFGSNTWGILEKFHIRYMGPYMYGSVAGLVLILLSLRFSQSLELT